MDERLDINARKQALALTLNSSRHEAKQAKEQLYRKVNAPKRIVGSVKNDPKVWLIGTGAVCLVGGIIVKSILRPRKVTKSAGLVKGTLLSIAIGLGKPYLKSFALNKTVEFIKNRAFQQQNPQTRPPAESAFDSPLGHGRNM